MIRRSSIIYGVLLVAWLAVIGWQIAEHDRVKQAARAELVNRARDISTTLGLVVRSQRRFGMVSQERLESALKELLKTDNLKGVSLLSSSGTVVASAGEPVPHDKTSAAGSSEHWDERSVTLVNLIDLGTNVVQEGVVGAQIIVRPRRDPAASTNAEWRGAPRDWWRPNQGTTNAANTSTNLQPGDSRRPPPRDDFGRPGFGRPPWMSEEEYKSLIEKQGLHSFSIVMSAEEMQAANWSDFWLRFIIGGFGGTAAAGFALAWRNLARSSELQIRLVRASELNKHLKEMNLAAAGLAHETRNPLNIIRGLSQLISKQADTSIEIRAKSREIADEVDRVTAQLNEFINYSKPREVRLALVPLNALVGEVVRALQYDLEDKSIQLSVVEEGLTVQADEQLLRQVLFNLLLNAIQAVEQGGKIQVVTRAIGTQQAFLDVRDDGPGVPPEQREEIFKPYFTTHQKGTGLGLAVVQQIVLAHGWEIRCAPNEPKGAVFRVSHLKIGQNV